MNNNIDFVIPPQLVEFILLGPTNDRRQLQDSPILGDVWVHYGLNPGKHLTVLLTPYMEGHSGDLAKALYDDMEAESDEETDAEDGCDVSFLRALVSANLTFPQLIRWVVPKTGWWLRRDENAEKVLHLLRSKRKLATCITDAMEAIRKWQRRQPEAHMELPPIERFVTLAAMLCWACEYETTGQEPTDPDAQLKFLLDWFDPNQAAQSLIDAAQITRESSTAGKDPLVYVVSLDRRASAAVAKSRSSVKVDAAENLFKVGCSDITWAILDSGIDGRHSAFLGDDKKSRIRASYDLGLIRNIVSMNNKKPAVRNRNIAKIVKTKGLLQKPKSTELHQDLERLADDAINLAPINWQIVNRYIQINPKTPPRNPHGTHVAGILGGKKNNKSPDTAGDGICPDINLIDLRVLGLGPKDTEFAIIAAIQLIQYLNDRGSLMSVHGANLSLSIPHDVRNFACGRTPICDECERLVNSGVVVVAAAGNHGYKNFLTEEGKYSGHVAFSITDPGNADSVLTVGSTHRTWPHTYGVSFFSSRGPTGDGRMKPDIVAPGERICAPLDGGSDNGGSWGQLDGTSMAAPHVSGAAAMLLARYPELVGQPRRIKQILMDSATNLGREATFQGRGMLDVLRAFQSI